MVVVWSVSCCAQFMSWSLVVVIGSFASLTAMQALVDGFSVTWSHTVGCEKPFFVSVTSDSLDTIVAEHESNLVRPRSDVFGHPTP